MKKYKIGRYWYQELSEEAWCDIYDLGTQEERNRLFELGQDGELIKYFMRVKK